MFSYFSGLFKLSKICTLSIHLARWSLRLLCPCNHHFVSLSGRCSALIQDNEIPAGCLHNEPPRYSARVIMSCICCQALNTTPTTKPLMSSSTYINSCII